MCVSTVDAYHALLGGEQVKHGVVPLEDVYLEEMCRGEDLVAGGAHVAVDRAVVQLIAVTHTHHKQGDSMDMHTNK